MCIFCRIASHELPANIVFEDDDLVAFHDNNPQAPTHLLVIPRKHITSLHDAAAEDVGLLGRLLWGARHGAEIAGLPSSGYRVVINTGAGAGQSVFHIHVHVLGGRPLGWPPG